MIIIIIKYFVPAIVPESKQTVLCLYWKHCLAPPTCTRDKKSKQYWLTGIDLYTCWWVVVRAIRYSGWFTRSRWLLYMCPTNGHSYTPIMNDKLAAAVYLDVVVQSPIHIDHMRCTVTNPEFTHTHIIIMCMYECGIPIQCTAKFGLLLLNCHVIREDKIMCSSTIIIRSILTNH